MYDYRGAIHLHSTYSDGMGGVDEIMRCANDVGLDFVVLTDHDTTQPIDDGHEKWHDSTLLMIGLEITPAKNHYIAFGDGKLKGAKMLRQKSTQEYIDAVAEQGHLGFIAHPDHTGTQRFGIPPLPWDEWTVSNFTGMGIWDLQTDWQSKLDRENITIDVYDNFARHLSGPTSSAASWGSARSTTTRRSRNSATASWRFSRTTWRSARSATTCCWKIR
jgi:hypothetical protein